MPRILRKLETTGSEHWLRLAVNTHTKLMDESICDAFGFGGGETIEWLSPIASDQYSEYRDTAFLERLGVSLPKIPLPTFWPGRGPQWDGLARTSSGRLLLVEAKAYLGEVADDTTKATDTNSKRLIEQSLLHAQEHFGATAGTSWSRTYYQYVNRLAHLYYLLELNGLDAYLIFLNFADAPDRVAPASAHAWIEHGHTVRRRLGLKGKRTAHVADIVWSVPKMCAGIGPA